MYIHCANHPTQLLYWQYSNITTQFKHLNPLQKECHRVILIDIHMLQGGS
uniref:Uncharacterized protein n=1 Tax=Arundo donax TaxID=35708 RepID=A0A0A8ZM06_ARUDO